MGENPPGREMEEKPVQNLKKLKEVLSELMQPEKKKVRESLCNEAARAKELAKKLSRRARLKALHMDASVLRSLRQIVEPKKQVHDVIVAFFLILGEYEGHTRVCTG